MNSRFALFIQLFEYMRERKRWIFGPLLILIVLFGVLTAMAGGSLMAPLLYTIF